MKILNITPCNNIDYEKLNAIENREKIKSLELLTIHDGRIKSLALVRWYRARNTNASVTYCVVRLRSYLMPIEHNETECVAMAKDETLGQDQFLFYFDRAIKNAGVKFEDKHSIQEPETILEAIAQANYNQYTNFYYARG